MRHPLTRHPDSQCVAAERIEVEIDRPSANTLALSYVVDGRIGDIRMPPAAAPSRGHELWRSTCFEAFVGAAPGADYYEFNFSPSTRWAAYRFSAYRDGMREAAEITVLPIEVRSEPDRYTLQASLDLDRLAGLARRSPWRLGLAALIEDLQGRKAYWALTHPPGKPDFHHADSFAVALTPGVSP